MRTHDEEITPPRAKVKPTDDPRKLRDLLIRRQAAQINWILVLLAMVMIAGWMMAGEGA